jgi:hypothetical protein
VNVLRVVNTFDDSPNLVQMDVVQGMFNCLRPYLESLTVTNDPIGEPIGSVQLDEAFENCAKQRLYSANQIIPMDFGPGELEMIAWKMAKEREFQNAKCGYGSWDGETEYFTVAIPGLRPDYQNTKAWISNGEMRFARYNIPIGLTHPHFAKSDLQQS